MRVSIFRLSVEGGGLSRIVPAKRLLLTNPVSLSTWIPARRSRKVKSPIPTPAHHNHQTRLLPRNQFIPQPPSSQPTSPAHYQTPHNTCRRSHLSTSYPETLSQHLSVPPNTSTEDFSPPVHPLHVYPTSATRVLPASCTGSPT